MRPLRGATSLKSSLPSAVLKNARDANARSFELIALPEAKQAYDSAVRPSGVTHWRMEALLSQPTACRRIRKQWASWRRSFRIGRWFPCPVQRSRGVVALSIASPSKSPPGGRPYFSLPPAMATAVRRLVGQSASNAWAFALASASRSAPHSTGSLLRHSSR